MVCCRHRPSRPLPVRALLFLVVLCATTTAAQPVADSTVVVRPVADSALVAIPFDRQPGDRATIRMVKSSTEREDGVLMDSVGGVWLIDARVLARRPRGYTLAWTYRAEGDESTAGRHFDVLTNTLEGIPIVFRTDGSGQPYEIANGDSLRAAIDAALRRLAPRAGASRRAEFDDVRATAATAAGLEAMLLPDVERFHLVSGGRYPAGRAATYRSALPNPFGGPPIPAEAAIRLTQPSADSVATIRWQQTPDARALARILIDLIAEVSPDRPQLTPAEIARRFGVEESATYQVRPSRGEVQSVRYRKDVRFGGRTRTERLTMETQPVEPSPEEEASESSG